MLVTVQPAPDRPLLEPKAVRFPQGIESSAKDKVLKGMTGLGKWLVVKSGFNHRSSFQIDEGVRQFVAQVGGVADNATS